MSAQMVMNSIATPHSWGLNTLKLSSSEIVVSPASRCFLPAISQARRARTRFRVSATSNGGDETKDPVTSSTSTSVTEETKSISEKRAKAEAEVKKGQTTAIVTGAISVLLGVGYLVLIQLLDTRGVILVPPPPEAFNP
ncbi:hypothetical protein M758_10G092600 [Ceratodon purpureus]|uniref:Uncharacterized protein n=1 Tax=Ceratodon purpureus TaxID=3225 RepID=A0A8T0GIL6_CERPU|nr:hypothetical protein KC19_10G094000 [Ceratodon purpureus]KAG0603418.1 hypothetical protein M758_10G092600 [Ceratodon purpureus]